MSEKDRLITLDKEQKRQEEKVKKLKEKQLYNEYLQKWNLFWNKCM